MLWFAPCLLFSCLVDLLTVRRLTDAQKDVQILLLRHQVRVLRHKARQPKRFSPLVKTLLTVLVTELRRTTSDFRAQIQPMLIFSPDTVLRWHRELVRRKWTFRRKTVAGRPRIVPELETLVLQLARDNARWGYDRIEGELIKLGFTINPTTIKNVLRRHSLLPAPQHGRSSSRMFLKHYRRQQMLACDFFTVETLCLQTRYTLFFIELGSRRIFLAGCTANPDSALVTCRLAQASLTHRAAQIRSRPPEAQSPTRSPDPRPRSRTTVHRRRRCSSS